MIGFLVTYNLCHIIYVTSWIRNSDDWYEYLFLLIFGDWDTDDEGDEIEVEEE